VQLHRFVTLPPVTIRRCGDRRLEILGLASAPGPLEPDDLARMGGVDPDRFDAPAVPAGSLLDALDIDPAADHVTVESGDGHYRASIPIGEVRRGGWLLLGEAGGGPVRLVVEEGRTLCWNVKEVVALRFTQGPEPDSVPENPEH
jgi:hypothetical protein